ncbi:MAG: synthase subunit epsilon [Myxococcaceae bacterium]|nr:synthase subunit epsilon [Myxococcaceae bacterium]
MALKVEVVTPERRLVQVDADEVIAPGADGLFGVRPGHAAYLAVLQPGLLTVKEGGGVEKKFFVAGGFCEVADDVVRVLADLAEPLEGIDVPAAQKAVTDAEAKLLEISPSLPAYEAQREVLKKAQVRFALASRR